MKTTRFDRIFLPLKLAAMISCVLGFLIGCFCFLSYSSYKKVFNTAIHSRFHVMMDQIRSNITTSLNLGLSLEEAPGIQNLLQHLQTKDPTIYSICIFSLAQKDKRQILYHTHAAHVGELLPKSICDAILHHTTSFSEKDTIWFFNDEALHGMGSLLYGDFTEPICGILLRFHTQYLENSEFLFLQKLLLYAFLGIGGIFILSFCILFFCTQKLIQSLHTINKYLFSTGPSDLFLPFLPITRLEENFLGMYKQLQIFFSSVRTLNPTSEIEKAHDKKKQVS